MISRAVGVVWDVIGFSIELNRAILSCAMSLETRGQEPLHRDPAGSSSLARSPQSECHAKAWAYGSLAAAG
jgi:hypothetical protein